jgi:hypothetical protein
MLLKFQMTGQPQSSHWQDNRPVGAQPQFGSAPHRQIVEKATFNTQTSTQSPIWIASSLSTMPPRQIDATRL